MVLQGDDAPIKEGGKVRPRVGLIAECMASIDEQIFFNINKGETKQLIDPDEHYGIEGRPHVQFQFIQSHVSLHIKLDHGHSVWRALNRLWHTHKTWSIMEY